MKDRKCYLDFIRIFACFMVIVNHNISVRGAYGSISLYKWVISDTFFAFCKTAIPLFLLISGSLLLRREENYKKYFQRIIHFLLLLFSWHIIDAIYWAIYDGKSFDLAIIFNKIQIFYYSESSFHMWYMYLIIAIYIMLPFIRKIAMNMKKDDWIAYSIIYGIFGLLPHFINSLECGISIQWHGYFIIPTVLEFYGIYLLGPLIDSIPLEKKYLIVSILVGIVSLFLNVFISTLLTIKNGTYSNIFDYAFGLLTVLLAITLFYIIKYVSSNALILSDKIKRLLVKLASVRLAFICYTHILLIFYYELTYITKQLKFRHYYQYTFV